MHKLARSFAVIVAAANGITPLGLVTLALILALVLVWLLAMVVMRFM
jgi:hypothetical protein